jgi:hypothetical protein
MTRPKTLEDWLSELMEQEKPSSTSTNIGTKAKIPESADPEEMLRKLREALEELAPDPEQIAGIVITSYIMPGWYSGYGLDPVQNEEKRYILVNRETWGSAVSIADHREEARFGHFAGIPVFDDEGFARAVLIYSIARSKGVFDENSPNERA